MKVFAAGVFTETNTFAPTPTGIGAFTANGLRRGEGSGAVPLLDGVNQLLQRLADEEDHDLVFGLQAIAQPGGSVVQTAWESLRDELLAGLRAALPVDAVILPLHGAMVATGCFDCEGELIERVRSIVGASVPIGVSLDLHCHFTERMRAGADVTVAYKEYPHTDALARLAEAWRLTLATAQRRIRPLTVAVDCAMTGLWPTQREPMAGFVRRMQALEGEPGVLSVSFGHGFPWGDVPEAGARIWVVTDDDAALAQRVATTLSDELWQLRDASRVSAIAIDTALDRVAAPEARGLVVIADMADNAGGGAASDSTFVLRRVVERGIGNVALGAFWDPGAVRVCHEAGVGAAFSLRVGGKCGPASGDPVDLRVTVRALHAAHTQRSLDGQRQACGAAAWVGTDDGVDLVLVSIRQQVLDPDLFTGLGIALADKRAVVVKSQQHFHAAFGALAAEVLYVDSPGLLRLDFENLPYRHRDCDFWPRCECPAARRVATA